MMKLQVNAIHPDISIKINLRTRMLRKLYVILIYLLHSFRKHFKFLIVHKTAIPAINLKLWEWGFSIQNFKSISIYIPSSTHLTVQKHFHEQIQPEETLNLHCNHGNLFSPLREMKISRAHELFSNKSKARK